MGDAPSEEIRYSDTQTVDSKNTKNIFFKEYIGTFYVHYTYKAYLHTFVVHKHLNFLSVQVGALFSNFGCASS